MTTATSLTAPSGKNANYCSISVVIDLLDHDDDKVDIPEPVTQYSDDNSGLKMSNVSGKYICNISYYQHLFLTFRMLFTTTLMGVIVVQTNIYIHLTLEESRSGREVTAEELWAS